MAGNKSDLNFFIWSATELDRFCGVNGSAWDTTKKSYNFWWYSNYRLGLPKKENRPLVGLRKEQEE